MVGDLGDTGTVGLGIIRAVELVETEVVELTAAVLDSLDILITMGMLEVADSIVGVLETAEVD